MSKIIFINGYPASGKSTLVSLLKEQNIQCPIICKDVIKEILFSKLDLDNYNHGMQLNNTVLAILFEQVSEHLRSGANLIIEGNFKPDYDQAVIDSIFKDNKCKVLQLMLVANSDQLLKRDMFRHKSGERHGGHTRYDRNTMANQLEQVRPFNIKGSRIITIDTTNFDFEDYNIIVNRIVDFIGS